MCDKVDRHPENAPTHFETESQSKASELSLDELIEEDRKNNIYSSLLEQ
jgi:hypothetical protein